MNKPRGDTFVNSFSTSGELTDFPVSHDEMMVCRGWCVLTDSNQIAGERYIKGFDIKATYDTGAFSGVNLNRYSVQFVVIPDGTNFKHVDHNNFHMVNYPFTNDTIYVTSLYDVYQNGVKVSGINKGVPRGYYLVALFWENYKNTGDQSVTTFPENCITLIGRVNITF